MQKACNTLGVVVLVLGIIGSIGVAWNNGVTVTYDSLEYQESISKRISVIEGKLSSAERKEKDVDDITYKGSWKCPQCGRVNASYTGTCGCGQVKK